MAEMVFVEGSGETSAYWTIFMTTMIAMTRSFRLLPCLPCVVLFAGLLPLLSPTTALGQWPQWGGPDRDFTVKAGKLADTWPEEGPRQIWKRQLGEGYSSIIVDKGMLYTMYRESPTALTEYTVALDAKTGKTVWEHGVQSSIQGAMPQYGAGPYSTPLVVGKRLYSVGGNTLLHCFDKKTGKVLWKHDLQDEYKLTTPVYGFSCSPIAYKKTIILPIIGEEPKVQRIIAYNQKTGDIVWQNTEIARVTSQHSDYSSPILIEFAGEDQLVFFTNESVIGFNPSNGKLLWKHPHVSRTGVNVTMPVWNGKDILFCSAAYDSGARAIRLKQENGKTVPEEMWFSRKLRVHHANAIIIGDYVYGSSGDFGMALFVGMDLKTGKPVWRKRGFSKATCVLANDKLILLDEDGHLALATTSPEGLTIHSKCKVLDRLAWTAPTLVKTTLYVRDREHIIALDLS